jgi:N-acetylglucosamine-6-sulfatase
VCRGSGGSGTVRYAKRLAARTGPVTVAFLIPALLIGPSATPAAGETAEPNIVVIVTDDQHSGTLRWMPNVQRRLVRKGTTFTRAISPTPTCCPSRASLLTGLLSKGTGVWTNGGNETPYLGGWPAFAANGMEDRTVATWLAPTYRTMLIGKYLNRFEVAGEGHVPPGWDEWHAFFETNGKYYDYRLMGSDGTISRYGNGPEAYSTDVLADLAVEAVRTTPSDTPLFLYFAPYAPHGPTTPARRHRHLGNDLPRYDAPSLGEDVGDKPPWIASLRRVRARRIAIRRREEFATLQSVDEAVAAILGALRREGRVGNTLVVFTTDNGVSWGEHRVPIADKFLPYDAQVNIPLVVRWDGVVPAGAKDDRVAANVDITTTLAAAAGVQVDGLHGTSLFGPRRRDVLLAAPRALGNDGNGLSIARPAYCGLRTSRWLYVRYASGEQELYDYRHDPFELRNVAYRRSARSTRARLRERTMSECAPTPPGY